MPTPIADTIWPEMARPANMPNPAPATAQISSTTSQPAPIDDLPTMPAISRMWPIDMSTMASTTPPAMPPTTPAPARLIRLDGAMYGSDMAASLRRGRMRLRHRWNCAADTVDAQFLRAKPQPPRASFIPLLASASARSLPSSPAWPLTHSHSTSCRLTSAASSCHRSAFFTGFLSDVRQPLRTQFASHEVMPLLTYTESVWSLTVDGLVRASSARIAAVSSMRLLVVGAASPPHSSFSWPL